MSDAPTKIAIVTGSTQGLGEAIARQLIDERLIGGLVICGRNAENGRRLAREFAQARLPHGVRPGRPAPSRRLPPWSTTARRAFDRIDYLVNSAATTERGTILDTTPELFDRIMALNVRAPFFLMQDAMQIDDRTRTIAGSILNIISMSSHGGQPFLSPYSMSKGALATLTRNVAQSVVQASHPRQRPQPRLDGHAGRGRDSEEVSRRRRRLAGKGRAGAAVRPAGQAAGSRAKSPPSCSRSGPA